VIIDMTIVNVSLPHMMGSMGARPDQITWVLTSFIAATAIVIPLTGFLTANLGRKRVMVIAITGFVVTSALCGMANSLNQIVVLRTLQGVFGAPLMPLSQSVMVDTFPGRERGKAMAIWGMGLMLGPALGPTLGGLITEHLTWRWVFYINVPVGILGLFMVTRLLRETELRPARPDLVGALAMAVGIGSLQVVLDQGNDNDWFQSHAISVLAVAALFGLALFIWRGLSRSDGIVDLRLLRDRNLAISCLMILAFGLGLFGTIVLQPMMLERLLDYPAQTTGLVMAPRAAGSAFSMVLVSRLIVRFDPRKLIAIGLLLAALGTWLMSLYSLTISPDWIIWPGVVQGLGMGLIFVPLATVAYETIPRHQVDAASGLFNLARTIGSSIGISIAVTLLTRTGQVEWNRLGGALNPYNPNLSAWLQGHGLSLQQQPAVQALAGELARQSTMVAFVDVFWLVSFSFSLLLPLLLLMHRPADQGVEAR
jgi:DHA2 family multidrug resistance protein